MPSKANPLPAASVLWEEFEFLPLKGELHRRAGQHKPCASNGKYVYTMVNRVTFKRSRLIWKWVHGSDPEQLIDHINRKVDDDRAWNLREIDPAGNCINRSAYGKQKVEKRHDRWVVTRRVNGRELRASFNDLAEAEWYAEALDIRMNEKRQELFADGSVSISKCLPDRADTASDSELPTG